MRYHYLITVQADCRWLRWRTVTVSTDGVLDDHDGVGEQQMFKTVLEDACRLIGRPIGRCAILFYRLVPEPVEEPEPAL